ncbi:hypothetical protein RN001_011318 [Aquatica leii]|uniref:CRAL-TRIO domain-containing protein n=1 Tax=Aquatica leii TaxID=1421715 RepID=A0AAN7PXN4_9COLE|nr:hypothetical protein RN001_011318 [Aquatica leii]
MSKALVKFGFTYNQLISDGFLIDQNKIDDIKNWLNSNNLPQLTNEQIVHFLLSYDENVEFTQLTIKAYFRIKNGALDVFADRRFTANDVQKAFNVASMCVWPKKTPEGYAVILYKFKNSDYWSWDLKHAAKIVFMAIECAIFDYPAKGLIVLADLKNFRMGHLIQLRPRPLKILIDYLQEALPVKLKEIHVFNSKELLNQLLAIVSPFMKKQLFEKIHFHSKDINWDTFYEKHLSKQHLCKDYGGDLPSSSDLEKLTIQKLIDMEEYFETDELWLQQSQKQK